MNTIAQQVNAIANDTSMTTEQAGKAIRKVIKGLKKDQLEQLLNCTHMAVLDHESPTGVAIVEIEESQPVRLATTTATKANKEHKMNTVTNALSQLPDFTRGSVLTSLAMSLNYRMMGLALMLIKRDLRESTSINAQQANPDRVPTCDDEGAEEDAPTRIHQFMQRERENHVSPADLPQSYEQRLYELQNVRAAFADAAFDANPKARIGFDQMLEDAKQPRVSQADIEAFMELDKELPREVVEKMFLQYAAQRCAEIEEHEAALTQVLRCYDTIGFDIDSTMSELPAEERDRVMLKLIDTVDRRQKIVDPMAINEPAWVARMNPLARFKESKLLKGALADLKAMAEARKPKRRAI